MRYNFIHFIKLTFILLMILNVGRVVAQTSCVKTGVTITSTGLSNSNYSGNNGSGCTSSPFSGSGAWTSGSNGGFIIYTFSNPMLSVKVSYTSVNSASGGSIDVGKITTDGGGSITLSNACGVSVSGNTITGNASSALADVSFTVTSTTAFTSVTLTKTGGDTGFLQGNPCDFTFTLACKAGAVAPVLSTNTKTNQCPATTVNLSSLATSATPSEASLVWFTNSSQTGTAYASPTTAAAGTYYASYYDSSRNCYSPATAAVTASIVTCCTSQVPDLTN